MTADLSIEARAWVATVARLAEARGVRLEGELAAAAEGLGCGMVFHARARAKGDVSGLARWLAPLASRLSVTLAELEAAGPTGMA